MIQLIIIIAAVVMLGTFPRLFMRVPSMVAVDLHGRQVSTTASAIGLSSGHVSQSLQEAETICLIGTEGYATMVERVNRLMQIHEGQEYSLVNLTAGPNSVLGTKILHRLLPGDRLTIRPTSDHGTIICDVYADGIRIGSLLLNDAEQYMAIRNNFKITGTYVSEQSCYGDSDQINLGIVMFHTNESCSDRTRSLITKETPAGIVKSSLN